MNSQTYKKTPISNIKPTREGYSYIDTTNQRTWSVPNVERISPMDRTPIERLPNGMAINNQPITMVSPQSSTQAEFMRKLQENKTGNCAPNVDQLLPETSTMVYTDQFFQQPEARLFLNNIQPNIYSYNVDLTPINSNIGISYTPQRTPKFRDQVYNMPENATYPLYTRIDPQLIRDEGVPARIAEMPERNAWSAHYSTFNPPPGSVNFEDVYDPRFTSYGDGTRAYSDVNLGNVQYYYSDVDAYRYPNFVTRSKVDFIDFTDPMGTVKPYYQRNAGLNDTRAFVSSQWMSDSNYQRENLMASQMEKANRIRWQTRFAPLSKANHAQHNKYG